MTLYALDGVAPTVPDDGEYWVAPNAQVMGKVILESGVGIWFGVVLRGDNDPIFVGEGTNIQENTAIHTDAGYPVTIGKNCTIGHSAIIHGCTIGDNSLIGMGATVLNGAVIGRNCLIGAGALVTEGKVIPDGSLVVGMPAKAIRSLDADTIKGLTQSALHYQDNMRRFRDGLKEI
jgi:carbonic anhydrase/acetyltransferase-like protein (isoleucine patch superfamily)